MSKVWHIQFDLLVSDDWVNDGFSLTKEVLTQIIQNGILLYAYDDEKVVRNLSIVEGETHHQERYGDA